MVAVTETWLDSSVADAELFSEGWNVLRRDRASRGGGVLLAARSYYQLERRRDLESGDGEDLWARLSFGDEYLFICVVYLSPRATASMYEAFFDKLVCMCDSIDSSRLLVLGDFNLFSAPSDVLAQYRYYTTYCALGQYNCIPNASGRMLDLVLSGLDSTRIVVTKSEESLVNEDLYHPTLDIEIKRVFKSRRVPYIPPNFNEETDWNFSKGNFLQLYNDFKASNWDNLYALQNVDVAVDLFYENIYKIFNNCIPKKIRFRHCSNFTYPTYFTGRLIRDIEQKAYWHRRYKQTGLLCDYGMFAKLRASVKRNTRLLRQNYIDNVQQNIKGNCKYFWKYINSKRAGNGIEQFVTRDELTYTGPDMADAFAHHFGSVFLADPPLLSTTSVGRLVGNNSCVDIAKIDVSDVFFAFRRFKSSTCTGPDGIPAYILKACQDYLIKPLAFIFNLSLQTGTYPDRWKVSRVTPIPKSGSRSSVENYRPVAVLCGAGKLFENCTTWTHLRSMVLPFVGCTAWLLPRSLDGYEFNHICGFCSRRNGFQATSRCSVFRLPEGL